MEMNGFPEKCYKSVTFSTKIESNISQCGNARSMASERPLAIDLAISTASGESRARISQFASGAFSSREITVFTGSNCSG